MAIVNHQVSEVRAKGVTGVPFTIIDGKWAVSGGQSAPVFVKVRMIVKIAIHSARLTVYHRYLASWQKHLAVLRHSWASPQLPSWFIPFSRDQHLITVLIASSFCVSPFLLMTIPIEVMPFLCI